MKNILYIATSDIHLKTFHIPYLEWLSANGHNVDLAFEDRAGISFEMVRYEYRLNFPRNINLLDLRKSFLELRRVIDAGDYDILHCHTPIPSALTRLAARKWRRRGGKLLYTAHGFHFYHGGPVKNWIAYYPAELLLSHLTDFIVTINREDLAYTKSSLWGPPAASIPGIGVQPRGFTPADIDERRALRTELGFCEEDFILFCVGEFIPRKNQRFIIEAAPELREAHSGLKIVFLGRGELMDDCKDLATQLEVDDMVRFMGFRKDVAKFAQIADVAISASKHEGLGIALLEQMMCSVPVVASSDRGHREFVENGRTGFLFKQNDRQEFLYYIKILHEDDALRKSMGARAHSRAQDFTLSRSINEMAKIYDKFL